LANNNRNRGNSYERACVNDMKEVGFSKAVSSRAESRNMDAKKVDICYTEPFYFQCKNMVGNIKYEEILNEMPNTENFNVILHKRTRKAKTSFITTGEYAFMKYADLLKIIKLLNDNGLLQK
jgi:hypothetical protein